MAIKLHFNFAACLGEHVACTLIDMKGYAWWISERNFGDARVQIEVDKAIVAKYKELLSQLSENQQEPIRETIEKCERKMAFVEKVIIHIHTISPEPDPRVEQILEKIPAIPLAQPPLALKKIEKYMQRLNDISNSHCTLPQFQQKICVRNQLNHLWKQLLLAKEQTKICRISDWLREDKEQAAQSFLKSLFFGTPIGSQFNNCCAEFIEQILINRNEQPRLFDRVNSPLAGICERDEDPYLSRMHLNQDDCFRPNFNAFHDRLKALLDVKQEKNLKNIAAIIRFGDRRLVLAIDPEESLYLFNQYGDSASQNYPYITAFGNLNQVSVVLNNLSFEYVEPMIEIIAVCCREELEEVSHSENSSEEESISPSCEAYADDFAAQPPTLQTAFFPVSVLQKVVGSLSLLNKDGFVAAIEECEQLSKFFFKSPINGEESHIKNRICFHLFQIQNKKPPDEIDPANTDWRNFLSTPEQKLRAAQRTQVEVLLATLSNYFEDVEHDSIANSIPPLFFGALKGLVLDPRDLPEGTKNLANTFFQKLYNNYKAAWEQNKTGMIDPDHDCFNGDFGRNALIGDARGKVPNAYKLQVLREIAQSLKEVWGI